MGRSHRGRDETAGRKEGRKKDDFERVKARNKPKLYGTRGRNIPAQCKYFDCPTAKKIMRRNIEALTRRGTAAPMNSNVICALADRLS